MPTKNLLSGNWLYFVGTGLTLGTMPAAAQTQSTPPGDVITEVVVTGTLLRGSTTATALPVTVISAEDLKDRGSPSALELLKDLPIANGIIGEANQFAAGKGQRAEGMNSVNLRGLGPERNLVLLNSHRLPLAAGEFVDAQKLPMAAIGQVEVLKDGAAATYGSDAVSGVVNFITRRDLDGVEIGADYRIVDGSDGDYSADITWGKADGTSNILVSAEFEHRSALPVSERDWAVNPYSVNPEALWSAAVTPSRFVPVNSAFAPLGPAAVDVGCLDVGGVLTNPNPASPGGFANCRATSLGDFNLVEEEDSYKLYAEINRPFSDTLEFHAEALYAHSDLDVNSAASFPAFRNVQSTVLPPGFPASITSTTPDYATSFYVPATNPGFAAYAAAHPGVFPAGTTGALIPVGAFRPYSVGGNPAFGFGPSRQRREQEQIRVSAGLTGDLSDDVHWATNITYGRYYIFRDGNDGVTGRIELALRGLGGPNCDFTTGTPGVGGCQWLNPFSNAIDRNQFTGQVNPGYNPAVAHDPALAAWLFPYFSYETTTQNFEYDAMLNGELRELELPGGNIKWAFGGQFRRNTLEFEPSELVNNILTPCPDSPITGNDVCDPTLLSPFGLGGTDLPLDLSQNVYAVFTEAEFPIFDALTATLGLRYEDYGSDGGGSTFNPQFRAKWQVVDAFALRGSIGSTFRAPPQNFLVDNPVVATSAVLGAVRPTEVLGNPDLEPETAVTFNVGALADLGSLSVSIDYWNIHLKDAITTEPLNATVAALFPNNGVPATGNCATLDPQFIADHFEFAGPCNVANLTRIRTMRINGPEIRTDGIDLTADYRFDDVLGGKLTVGVSATYINQYEVGELRIGSVLAAAKADLVGFLNDGNSLAYPLPRYKGSLYLNWHIGAQNFRWTTRITDSYRDNRTGIFLPSANYCTDAANPVGCGTVPYGQKINGVAIHDAVYRVAFANGLAITATVTNVFDKDPPFVRKEYSYDAQTFDPLGRTFKLGAEVQF